MTVSPASSNGTSAASSSSTTAAGSINQTTRGAISRLTKSSSDAAATAPSFSSAFPGLRVDVVNDAFVASLYQSADHAGAHASKSEHAELHPHYLLFCPGASG